MNKKRIIVFFLVLTIIPLVYYYFGYKSNKKGTSNINQTENFNINIENILNSNQISEEYQKVNNSEFSLKNQYNKCINLQEYREKKVILFFWQIWCPACVEELDVINKLYLELGNNEQDVILLTLTKPKTNEEDVEKIEQEKDKTIDEIKEYIKTNNYVFPVLFDEKRTVFNEFGVTSYPTTIILDEEGNEIYRKAMQKISKDEIISSLD